MCSRIVVEVGEVGAAEEWMAAASVVGSAVRYLFVALGGEEEGWDGSLWAGGGDQRPRSSSRRRRIIECLLAVKLRVLLWCSASWLPLPVVESGEGQDTWEVRWSGKMANSHGCECSSRMYREAAVVQVG